MSQPLISVLHPTARVVPSEQFPRGWRDVFDIWLSRADHPEQIEYVLSVHESRYAEFEKDAHRLYEDAADDGWKILRGVCCEDRDCCVDNLNNAAKHSTGKLLVATMDDLYPPEHWDTLLLGARAEFLYSPYLDRPVRPAIEDDEAIIVCSSGATPERDLELMISGAMTRKRYERYGFVLDADFESMFADNWYAHVARRDEAAGLCNIIERLDIQFEHRHPIYQTQAVDEVYKQQNRAQAYQDGEITFKRKLGTKLLAIAQPGQQFSASYLHGWTVLYGHLMAARGFLTMPIQAYTSNVHCTRMDIVTAILEARHKPDRVLSIDDDNILTPQQFDMLDRDLDEDPTLAGVVGWCWCDPADPTGDKNSPYVASCGRQKGWHADRTENGEGLSAKPFDLGDFERHLRDTGRFVIHSDDLAPHAFWSGFPVVLMRYETVKQLGPDAFLPMVRPDVKFGFTSEDTTFFYRAHQRGLKFGVDMRVKVPHLKLRAIEAQYLPGVTREQVLEAQGKTLGRSVRAEEEKMLLAEA